MVNNLLSIHAKSFSWAGFFLPSDVYKNGSDLYDFCRILDDIADEEISFLELVQNFKWTDTIVIDAQGIETFFVEAIEFTKRGLDFVREQPQVQKIFCE